MPVQTSTYLFDRIRLIIRNAGRHRARTLDEQVRGGADVQRPNAPHLLVRDSKAFPTGRQDLHRAGARQDRLDELRRRIEDVLAVVEYEQSNSVFECDGNRLRQCHARLLSDTQHRRHSVGNGGGIRHSRKFEKPYAVWELVTQLPSGLKCQPGLADTAHAGQSHESMSAQRLPDVGDVCITTDQAAGCGP